MKELDTYIKGFLYNKNNLRWIIKEFKDLSDLSQPQYIRKASFLGYTTIANNLKQQGEVIFL
jgi:hypothetical protein